MKMIIIGSGLIGPRCGTEIRAPGLSRELPFIFHALNESVARSTRAAAGVAEPDVFDLLRSRFRT
jgi:hypothetical protein